MYILNLTNTVLSLGRYVEINPGKYISADKDTVNSEEVAYAVRAKFASLHEAAPKEIDFGTEAVNFEKPAIQGSSEFPGSEPALAKPAEEDKEKEAEPVAEKEAEPEVVEESAEETPAPKARAKKTEAK